MWVRGQQGAASEGAGEGAGAGEEPVQPGRERGGGGNLSERREGKREEIEL